jgi:hypothetical protein
MQTMTIEEYRAKYAKDKATKKAQGAQAKEVGDDWETTLNDYHALLLNLGKASISKTGPVVKWISRNTVKPIAPGPADYVGAVKAKDGRAIAIHFEAKSTNEEQGFSLPRKSLHQKRRINDVVKVGGIGFYLVEWRVHGVVQIHLPGFKGQRIRYEDGFPIIGCQWYAMLDQWGWL